MILSIILNLTADCIKGQEVVEVAAVKVMSTFHRAAVRSLRAERWGNIYRLSIPEHNRIFMNTISTCWNRNDFDLTIIYISIWVARPQWELPYILCVWVRNGGGACLHYIHVIWETTIQMKYNSVCCDFELSSISRERFSSSETDNLEMFHSNIFYSNSFEPFTIQCFSPKRCLYVKNNHGTINKRLKPWIIFISQFSKLPGSPIMCYTQENSCWNYRVRKTITF